MIPENRTGYGGFWVRFGAASVDFVALLIPTLLVSYLYRTVTPARSNIEAAIVDLVDAALNLCVWWVYTAVMLSSSWQATLGKRALGLKVVGYDGAGISFQRATGRHFASIVSGLCLFVGFAMMAWTERRQGLHDFMAKTLVVRADVFSHRTPRSRRRHRPEGASEKTRRRKKESP